MRQVFVDSLLRFAKDDPNVILITGDVGYGVLDRFAHELPRQFINAGISEQNMIGVAAGMSLRGRRVLAYSIANFATLRCLEQIRNDVCYHNLDVTIVSVGAGLSYGTHGYSHFAIEDVGCLRSFPNISIWNPADTAEAQAIAELSLRRRGPHFVRLGKTEPGSIHEVPVDVEKPIEVVRGEGLAVFSTGPIVNAVKTAINSLNAEGHSVGLYSFPCLHPMDRQLVRKYVTERRLGRIAVIEEHVETGGLNSIISEIIAGSGIATQVMPWGVAHRSNEFGNREYLLELQGLSAEGILRRLAALV